MSEQENQNSSQGADALARKEWKKPAIVELSEANGDGAEGGKIHIGGESTFAYGYGPS